MRKLIYGFLLMLVAFILTGCNFNTAPQGDFTPTAQEVLLTPVTPTLEATLTVTAPPVVTAPPQVVIESPTATATPAPPTLTLTPSQTPGPYEHTITQGESLITIVGGYGYTDFTIGSGGIIDQVVILNGLFNADTLPSPGTVILVPRQTATPVPQNTETAVAVAATEAAVIPNVTFPANSTITQYVVQPNDTVVGIAQDNNLTLEQIAVLNQELDFFSCNFEIPSGGAGCNVPLQEGQVLNLPAPTPTPTLSPTPSGSETPTPTPTYLAPMLVYPPVGAIAPPGIFSLQWVGVGVLNPDEVYLVEVTDMTTPNQYRQVTRNTALQLPDSLIPSDGQAHTFNWTVYVATPNEQGVYRPIGGIPEVRSFQWQSR